MSSFRAESPAFPADLTRFSVLTDAHSSALARVVEVFAMRSLLPTRLHSVIGPSPANDSDWAVATIDIEVAGLGADDASLIARNLGRLVGVRSVRLAPG